jgi:hypothetical protein
MKFLIPISILTVLILSCKKEQPLINDQANDVDDNIETTHSLPSVVGAYWVYDWYLIDSLDQSCFISLTDTVTITGDTLINGDNYVIYSGTYYGNSFTSFQRDSLGFIISPNGSIYYSLELYADTLFSGQNNLHYYFKNVNPNITSIQVPFGSYNVIQNQLHWGNLDASPFTACGDQEFIEFSYYDQYLGEIASQTAFLSEAQFLCQYRERRLVDYYQP